MAVLTSVTRQQILLKDLDVARTFISRLVGLLGRKNLGADQGLWIHDCNSIHTFFMRFPIDCVFIDDEEIVCSIKENVKPFGLVWPQWTATSVIELTAGRAKQLQIEVGEKLNVGSESP